MALTERNRSALFQGLTTVIDEEAVEEMLSYFPARDVEEPATKEFLRAESALLRTELKDDMALLRTEFKDDMAALRTELKDDMTLDPDQAPETLQWLMDQVTEGL